MNGTSSSNWQTQLAVSSESASLMFWTSASGGSPLGLAQLNALIGSGDYDGAIWLSQATTDAEGTASDDEEFTPSSAPATAIAPDSAASLGTLALQYECAVPPSSGAGDVFQVASQPVTSRAEQYVIGASLRNKFNGSTVANAVQQYDLIQGTPQFTVFTVRALFNGILPKDLCLIQFYWTTADVAGTRTGGSFDEYASGSIAHSDNTISSYTQDPDNKIDWYLDNSGKTDASITNASPSWVVRDNSTLRFADAPQNASSENAAAVGNQWMTAHRGDTIQSIRIVDHFETYVVIGGQRPIAKITWACAIDFDYQKYLTLQRQFARDPTNLQLEKQGLTDPQTVKPHTYLATVKHKDNTTTGPIELYPWYNARQQQLLDGKTYPGKPKGT